MKVLSSLPSQAIRSQYSTSSRSHKFQSTQQSYQSGKTKKKANQSKDTSIKTSDVLANVLGGLSGYAGVTAGTYALAPNSMTTSAMGNNAPWWQRWLTSNIFVGGSQLSPAVKSNYDPHQSWGTKFLNLTMPSILGVLATTGVAGPIYKKLPIKNTFARAVVSGIIGGVILIFSQLGMAELWNRFASKSNK